MARKRLLLVHPVNNRYRSVAMPARAGFPPLALGYLAALTPGDWEIDLIDENWERFKYRQADLVAITAYTSAVNRAYDIAAAYREKGVKTVLGGMHASVLPEEALCYFDTVVLGEAEGVWHEVISDFEAGRMESVYRGGFQDLKGLVHPRRDIFKPYVYGTILTSRGCPMDCNFCSISRFYNRLYRLRPIEEVLDELETIPNKRIWILDDNFLLKGRQSERRAISFFRGIIERGIKKELYCTTSMNFADNEEVLEYASRAGYRLTMLGVETKEEDALREVNKRLNLNLDAGTYEEVFDRCHRRSIGVLGYFMFGMDTDTPERIRRRIDYIVNSDIDIPQMTVLTPLPGTRLMDKLEGEGRLIYTDFPRDWDRYDMMEMTYRPARMSLEEFRTLMGEAARRVYSLPAVLQRARMTRRKTGSIYLGIEGLLVNTGYRRVVGRALQRAASADVH